MLSRCVAALVALGLTGCSSFMAPETPDAPGFGTTSLVIEAPFSLTPDASINSPVTPQVAGWSATVVDSRHQVITDEFPAAEPGVYRLDTGDKLRLFVYAQPSLSRIYTVDQEGQISVPLIGQLRVRGQTTRGVEAVVRNRLAAQYVRDPHVTVDIQQNRPFFILGEVRNAGQYPYVSGLTVQSAVAVAGGYSERANERKVQITRRINGQIEKMEAAADVIVLPGDTIYVSERWF